MNNRQRKIAQFKDLPINERGYELLGMTPSLKNDIVKSLSVKEIVDMVGFLDPEKSAKILRYLPTIKKKLVLKRIEKNIQEKIEFLCKFDPKSAAGIMNLNYIEADKNSTVKDIAKMIEEHEKATGRMPTILITEKGYLIGEVPMQYFVLANKRNKAAKFARKIPKVHYSENETSILNILKKHPHGKVVVLDDNESILGVIHTDDVMHLIERQTSKSLHKFAGVSRQEDIEDEFMTKVGYRYKWLIINLFTAFFAAAVIGLFENTISKLVVLAAYLPIVAGMGGNAATQTLAVTVRGIALGEIDKNKAKKIIFNESAAGVVNGIITGAIAATIAFFLNHNMLLGVVLALAMVFNLLIAGFFGTLIPLIMKRLGKDPATSATIFITTATDVFGFMAFLGLATLILF